MKQQYSLGEEVNVNIIGKITAVILSADGGYNYKITDYNNEAWVKEDFIFPLPTELEPKSILDK